MAAAGVPELQAVLDAAPFTRGLGARVVSAGDGDCTLEIPYDPDADRPGGIVNGARYVLAADVAFWLAVKTLLGVEDASVTSGLTTAFLASARREPFICRARVVKCGRRLVYGEAECIAGERLLARHTLTYAR